MWGKLGNILSGNVIGGADKLIGTLFGDKDAQDRQEGQQQVAIMDAFANEFLPKRNHTWFDSLIDGLNRLPRPFITFGIIGFISYSVYDPLQFMLATQALKLVPSYLWGIFFTVITFWFGGKLIGKDMKIGRVDPEVIKAVLAMRNQFQKEKNADLTFNDVIEERKEELKHE